MAVTKKFSDENVLLKKLYISRQMVVCGNLHMSKVLKTCDLLGTNNLYVEET